jgi:putative spermidine/putrescine transport system substrate-binding protein
MRTSLGRARPATRITIAAATAIVAPLALAACGSSAASGGSGDRPANEVVIAAPGGSYQTGMTSCAYSKFTQETGIKVVYQAGVNADNLAKVQAQKRNPTIDVLQDNVTSHNTGVKQGLFEKVDETAVPNRKTVAPDLQPQDGYGVTASGLVAGIAYNAKVFKEHGWAAPTKWEDLWDPKFKGHVALPPVSSQYMQAWIGVLARQNGGSESNLQPAFDKLKSLKPQLYGVLASPAQLDTAFQQGDAWIAIDDGARISELKKSGVDMGFVRPAGGPIFISVGFDLVKNSPNSTGAKLLNFLLSDDAQNCFLKKASYGVVSQSVTISADEKNFVPHGDDESTYAPVDWTALGPQLSTLTDQWNKVLQ